MSDETKPMNIKVKGLWSFLIALVIISILATAWWYFKPAQNDLVKSANKTTPDNQDVTALVEAVSRHIMIAEEEVPLVATIQDAKALAEEQKFYVGSSNGDKLLIYPTRAIIYSQTQDKLINVGPIQVLNQLPTEGGVVAPETKPEEESTTTKPKAKEENVILPQAPNPLKLDIRNGSGKTGAASVLATQLTADAKYQAVNIGNAIKANYSGIILVNIGGYNIAELENTLGVKGVSALPEGEPASQADAVIIIGK